MTLYCGEEIRLAFCVSREMVAYADLVRLERYGIKFSYDEACECRFLEDNRGESFALDFDADIPPKTPSPECNDLRANNMILFLYGEDPAKLLAAIRKEFKVEIRYIVDLGRGLTQAVTDDEIYVIVTNEIARHAAYFNNHPEWFE